MEYQKFNKPSEGMGGDDAPQGRGDRGDRDFGGGGGGGGGRSFGRGFGRKKVDPFIVDKTLVLDYKNIKVIGRFITETGRIVPRHVTGVSAKNQRKLTKFIKRARNLGFIAPKVDG